MARKKQEIALQKELNTQEEWDDAMTKEGLLIVDVYQDWCGPCKSIVSHFRRIKNESGEDLLQFAVAKADSIDSLDRYRGKCKPCFLFYGSGTLVEVVRGVNPPVLEKKIKAHLTNELNVLKGEPGAERVEIRDPEFKHLDEAERLAKQRADEDEEEEEVEREVTVVLIKPDAQNRVDEIMQRLEERGIEILEQQKRRLTQEEARDFYRHLEDQEWFEQMITYMTTDESTVLVISKGNSGIISEFREILGPANVEEAKETQPDSLRAMFGSESFKNAIHAADSGEKAARELEFFFPEFKVPTFKVHKAKKEKHKEIEKTVALIRPDAFVEFKDEILAKIKEAGFAIALRKEVQLTREQAEQFYSEKKDNPFFPELITRMTNGPVLALALAKEDAIKEWRKALGEKDPKEAKQSHPQSLRAMYSKEDIQINLLHGSDSSNSAKKELDFFFPVEQTLVVIKPDAYENRREIIQKAKEAEFRIAARKELILSDEMAREFYKTHADKEYFEELVAHMTSGKSIFMVLSRNDAIHGWRELMGLPDPTQAPDNDHSIRSIFGKDIKSNAVHGSSSKEHAESSIRLIFGDIKFDHEGKRVPGTGDLSEEDEMETTEDEGDADGEMRGPNGEIVRTDAQAARRPRRKEGEDSDQEHDQHEREHEQVGDDHEGEYQEGEHHEGEHHEGEHHEGEHHEGEHHEGEHHEGEHHEGEHHEGEHHGSEHHEGEHHEGEHHEGEHHEGEQHESEHHEGEQHDGEPKGVQQDETEHKDAEHHEDQQDGGHTQGEHKEEHKEDQKEEQQKDHEEQKEEHEVHEEKKEEHKEEEHEEQKEEHEEHKEEQKEEQSEQTEEQKTEHEEQKEEQKEETKQEHDEQPEQQTEAPTEQAAEQPTDSDQPTA